MSKENHLPDLLYVRSLSLEVLLLVIVSCLNCVSWPTSFLSNTPSESQFSLKVEHSKLVFKVLSVTTSANKSCFGNNSWISCTDCWPETYQENKYVLYHVLEKRNLLKGKLWMISLNGELNYINYAFLKATAYKHVAYHICKTTPDWVHTWTLGDMSRKKIFMESVTYQKSKELENHSAITAPNNIGYDIHWLLTYVHPTSDARALITSWKLFQEICQSTKQALYSTAFIRIV